MYPIHVEPRCRPFRFGTTNGTALIVLIAAMLAPVQSWAGNCSSVDLSSLPTDSYRESLSPHSQQRGYVLVFHGLNLNPDRLDAIGSFLNEEGFATLTVKLTGHRGAPSGLRGISYSKWYRETVSFHCAGTNRADALGVPLFLIGYSLGGVASLDVLIDLQEQVAVRSIVLLAPAIELRWQSRIFGWLPFLPDDFMISSRSPQYYRANEKTSLGAYRAMYRFIDEFGSKSGLRDLEVPVLVLMDPDDGLVSWNGLRAFARKRKLTWKFFELNNDHSELEEPIDHLIIDAASLGAEQWQVLKAKTVAHFLDS